MRILQSVLLSAQVQCVRRAWGLNGSILIPLWRTPLPAAARCAIAMSQREKVLLLIVDGIGDVSIPAFGDRTPLQVAHTPVLDALASAGLNGLMDPVEPGLACGSDTAHMSIFGYDPRVYYRCAGRLQILHKRRMSAAAYTSIPAIYEPQYRPHNTQ